MKPIKTNGAGKYDAACTVARLQTNAAAVVLIVAGGSHGDGFSVQTVNERYLRVLPDMLEHMAHEIRKEMEGEPDGHR